MMNDGVFVHVPPMKESVAKKYPAAKMILDAIRKNPGWTLGAATWYYVRRVR